MKVLAILGSYRQGQTIDQAAKVMLQAANAKGARVETVQLRDQHIAFCTNCRACMQQPGTAPGDCPLQDEMPGLIFKIMTADRLILASPINCGTVTAIYKRFMERSVVFGYWPWGQKSPQRRQKNMTKKAVLLTSSAAPRLLTWLFSDGLKRLRGSATLLGAKPVGQLVIGMAGTQSCQPLPESVVAKARRLGERLVR